MTSVVIADDQDLVRDGIRLMLETRGLDVLATAADGRRRATRCDEHDPDVVLMDIRMPGLDGIEATRETLESQSRTRVLVLTTYDLDEYVYEALRAGAAGFLLKTTPPDRLVAGIECVADGDALLAPTVTRRLIAQHVAAPRVASGPSSLLAALTDREREVLVPHRRRLVQRRHRSASRRERGNGQDPRQPNPRQASSDVSGPGRGAGVRDRPRSNQLDRSGRGITTNPVPPADDVVHDHGRGFSNGFERTGPATPGVIMHEPALASRA